jgi:hypothetical protein
MLWRFTLLHSAAELQAAIHWEGVTMSRWRFGKITKSGEFNQDFPLVALQKILAPYASYARPTLGSQSESAGRRGRAKRPP